MNRLRWLMALAAGALFFKVLYDVLAEYRWYFPADFDRSAFLSGRRFTFFGLYRAAFYLHVVSGPVVSLLSLFLIVTGGRPRWGRLHRWAGKGLAGLVLLALVPSGLVMAKQAYAGPLAGLGFAGLSLATGVSAAGAAYFAIQRNFRIHQQWAIGCFILLTSPLLLRVAGGMALVLDCDSERFYQLNAWLSWLAPLLGYLTWLAMRRAGFESRHRFLSESAET